MIRRCYSVGYFFKNHILWGYGNQENLHRLFFKKKETKKKKRGFNCRPHPSGMENLDRNQTPLWFVGGSRCLRFSRLQPFFVYLQMETHVGTITSWWWYVPKHSFPVNPTPNQYLYLRISKKTTFFSEKPPYDVCLLFGAVGLREYPCSSCFVCLAPRLTTQTSRIPFWPSSMISWSKGSFLLNTFRYIRSDSFWWFFSPTTIWCISLAIR